MRDVCSIIFFSLFFNDWWQQWGKCTAGMLGIAIIGGLFGMIFDTSGKHVKIPIGIVLGALAGVILGSYNEPQKISEDGIFWAIIGGLIGNLWENPIKMSIGGVLGAISGALIGAAIFC